jgi:hypothetical protein
MKSAYTACHLIDPFFQFRLVTVYKDAAKVLAAFFFFTRELPELHSLVIWPASAFGHHPIDDLIRIGDITGLAVHAIGGVDF